MSAGLAFYFIHVVVVVIFNRETVSAAALTLSCERVRKKTLFTHFMLRGHSLFSPFLRGCSSVIKYSKIKATFLLLTKYCSLAKNRGKADITDYSTFFIYLFNKD